MLAIKIFSFVGCTVVAFVGFYIFFWIFIVARWGFNGIKKQIVWIFMNNISRLTIYPAQRKFRQEIIEIGFSMGCNHRSGPISHYRYKDVFVGTYRNIIVKFENNFKLKVNIKEESLLYHKLMSLARG